MIAAFISAISNAAETIFDKAIMGEKNMTGLRLVKIAFVFVSIWMFIPMLLWGSIKPEFFSAFYLGIFGIMIVFSILHNLLYFTAFEKKDVCEVEPIALLTTPITILLAMLFFANERNYLIFVITIVATVVLLLSRLEKKHLDFDKYSLYILGHDIFIALEAVLIKYLLNVTNAVSLYGIRALVLAVLFLFVLWKINFKKVPKKEFGQLFLVQGIVSLEFVARFFAIGYIGIVKTSLILLLGPILILLFSRLFLKEKITIRRGIGDAIIILLVAVTIFI